MKSSAGVLSPCLTLLLLCGFFYIHSVLADPGDENWDALLCPNGPNYPLLAMTASGNDVYLGGLFESAGGVAAKGIVKWDGKNFLPLGEGLSATDRVYVLAIASLGKDIY